MALIVALVVATTYWQAWAAGDLADRQDNQIERVAQFTIKRGEIRGNGAVYARNRAEKVGGRTLYFREYPQRELAAHVHGYSTQSRFRTGLERSLNDYLTGQNANLSTVLDTTLDRLKGATIKGNDLRLTLVPTGAAGGAERARQPLRRRGRARALDRQGARHGLLARRYDPNLVEEHFDQVTGVARRLQAARRAAEPRHGRPLRARLDLQGRHRLGGDRLGPLRTRFALRRPGLLRGLRQAREQLRHHEPVRPLDLRDALEVLRQLGLLQHRQGAGREEARRVREALRLLLDAAARDPVQRARAERALQGHEAVRSRRRTQTSTRAGSRSARSACS